MTRYRSSTKKGERERAIANQEGAARDWALNGRDFILQNDDDLQEIV